MPPKKDEKGKGGKSSTDGNNKGGKKKKIGKGEGMGGTIGLAEKEDKKCILPCVKSFSQPPACCPQEMSYPMPACCPPPVCPGSTTCCYFP